MEGTMARPRYVRRTAPGRRYKRTARETGRLPRIIARQFLIALALLVAVSIIKSVNTPATNFISDKVRFALQQNLDLKSIFGFVDKTVVNLKNSILPGTGNPAGEKDSGQLDDNGPADAAGQTNATGQVNAAGQVDATGQADSTGQADAAAPSQPESSVLSATYVADTETALNMQIPVNGVLSSRFGKRTDPLTGVIRMHEGIDIEADRGADIKAVLDGVVEEAGSSPSYGNYLRLKHQNGLETVYAHCSSLDVKKDSTVKQGDVIARVGDSGASVGTHLHFEVLREGKPVDPLGYLSFDGR